jgi:hypothetical protein
MVERPFLSGPVNNPLLAMTVTCSQCHAIETPVTPRPRQWYTNLDTVQKSYQRSYVLESLAIYTRLNQAEARVECGSASVVPISPGYGLSAS